MPKRRNYEKEYENYQGKPEQIHNRALRNKARAQMVKKGKVHKGDGMDVDHKKPLIKGGGTSLSNLRIQTDNNNRSFKRTKKAGYK
jgi:hypothetical protein